MRSETVILDPVSHVPNSGPALGRTRFQVPTQGILDLHATRLIYGARLAGSQGTDAGDTMRGRYSTSAGAPGLIRTARLFLAGREVSALEHANHYLSMTNNLFSQDTRESLRRLECRESPEFTLDATAGVTKGQVVGPMPAATLPLWSDEVNLTHDATTTPMASIRLSELFGLATRQLPLALIANQQCEVEIVWESDVNALAWAVETANNAAVKSFQVVTPRLSVESVFYNAKNLVAQMHSDAVATQGGLSWSFPRTIHTQKAVGTAAAEPSFTHRYAMSGLTLLAMFFAFVPAGDINLATTGMFVHRALGDDAYSYQLRVNDKLVFERPVDNPAHQWSLLSAASGKPVTVAPGQFSAKQPSRVHANSVTTMLASKNVFGVAAPGGSWEVGPAPIEMLATRAHTAAAFAHHGTMHGWAKLHRTIAFVDDTLKIAD